MGERGPLRGPCLVVRGGLMEVETLRAAASACRASMGFYGLSLWGENDMSLEEICRAAVFRNLLVRPSTVACLRAIGLEPVRSGRPPHLTLRLPAIPTDEALERLAGVFDPPIPNPRFGV